jgi:hypothetical protein
LNEGPLAKSSRLRKIEESFAQLQDERLKADYMPPAANVIERSKAQELLAEARVALAELNGLDPIERQTLVVRLLIKESKR